MSRAATAKPQRIRPPAVAGTFYAASAARLCEVVDRLLDEAEAPVAEAGRADASEPAAGRAPLALLVPHAGYVYSGPVAARAYRTLLPHRRHIRHVVLLGPAHRARLQGLALPDADAFATPLGLVPVDAELAAEAGAFATVRVDAQAHAGEHSIEVQLPFLQRVLPELSVLPLTVGLAATGDVACVIERFLGRAATIVVVSSDLSHYLPYDEARAIDESTVRRILRLEAGGVALETACGAPAVNGLLLAARRAGLEPRLLDLRSSGDTAGPRDEVVGYAAIAFEGTGVRGGR